MRLRVIVLVALLMGGVFLFFFLGLEHRQKQQQLKKSLEIFQKNPPRESKKGHFFQKDAIFHIRLDGSEIFQNELRLSEEGALEIQKCFPRQNFRSLEEVWEYLVKKSGGVVFEKLIFQNIHLRTASGARLRLNVEPQGLESFAHGLRVFGEDSEGYPVRQMIPKSLEPLPLSEKIKKLSQGAQILFQEREAEVLLKDQSRWRLSYQGEKVKALRLIEKFSDSVTSLMCDVDYSLSTIECLCR